MEKLSTQARGAAYRVDTLKTLAALGYASTRQIARIVWKRCDGTSRRMANRTLRALAARRLVVSKRDGQGVNRVNYELLFALTPTGAEEVRRHGSHLVGGKVHARDYIRHAHAHRTACNSVYAALSGTRRWSELQVRAGDSPLTEFRYRMEGKEFGKVADLIVVDGDGYEWIEVENSWRSDADLLKVVDCMRDMFALPGPIKRMHFVVTVTGARRIGQRLKNRLTHGPQSGWGRQVRELDSRILAQHLRVSVLDSANLELSPILI